MARKRKGLTGDKKGSSNNLENYFDELMDVKEEETKDVEDVVVENDPTPSPSETEEVKVEEDEEETPSLEEKIAALDKVEEKVEETSENPTTTEKPTVKVKGGKLKIATSKKVVKLNRDSFTKLNSNKKYNLQKKNNENAQQLATETKTFSVRPDLLDILTDVVDGQYGMNTKIVQNALINELVRIGVLDEDSLSEMLDY